MPHYASECFDELSADHYTAHLGVQRNSNCIVPIAAKNPKIGASLVLKCQPNNTLSKARLL